MDLIKFGMIYDIMTNIEPLVGYGHGLTLDLQLPNLFHIDNYLGINSRLSIYN